MCPLDKARRVLLGRWMRKLESISRGITTGFTKFDVFFKGFFDSFCWFLRVGNVWSKNRVLESIELIEFYLESCYLGWKVRWSESFQEILESWPKISCVWSTENWTIKNLEDLLALSIDEKNVIKIQLESIFSSYHWLSLIDWNNNYKIRVIMRRTN